MCINFCCQSGSKSNFQGNPPQLHPAPSQTPHIKYNGKPSTQPAKAASQPAVHSAQIVALHPTSKTLRRTQNHLQHCQSSSQAASHLYQLLFANQLAKSSFQGNLPQLHPAPSQTSYIKYQWTVFAAATSTHFQTTTPHQAQTVSLSISGGLALEAPAARRLQP